MLTIRSNQMASSETIGNMITYKADYLSRDYPILFMTPSTYDTLDRLITEVDYEYRECVHPTHPLLYVLHQESYGTYGMHMFRSNSNTWEKWSDR